MNNTAIDLSSLPPPEIVETINFEVLLAERKAGLIALYPPDKQGEIAATLELESEPLVKWLQENCYREMKVRQRVNDAARGIMLAYARGTTLDHLGALMGVARLVVQPADPLTNTPAIMESDDDLRARIQMAPEAFSVAGPAGAYVATAMNASGRVLHAAASSPAPGTVLVNILSRDGDGTADDQLVQLVTAALNSEKARPLTDQVLVQSAEIVPYQVEATVYTFPGPDPDLVMETARARLDAYLEFCHRIGRQVATSGIDAALHVPGVESVVLAKPMANVVANATQAPHCTAVTVNYGGTRG
jgi:phage-related baseplate assembly protein